MKGCFTGRNKVRKKTYKICIKILHNIFGSCCAKIFHSGKTTQELLLKNAGARPILSGTGQVPGICCGNYTGERVVLSGAKPAMPVYTDPAGFVADKTCRASV
ncbi:MAG: hypothetical protein J5I98_02985 [Phaeodactylibacter sp.]|nr:hypothetical protein [Phaeodactylibacter sp.]